MWRSRTFIFNKNNRQMVEGRGGGAWTGISDGLQLAFLLYLTAAEGTVGGQIYSIDGKTQRQGRPASAREQYKEART